MYGHFCKEASFCHVITPAGTGFIPVRGDVNMISVYDFQSGRVLPCTLLSLCNRFHDTDEK